MNSESQTTAISSAYDDARIGLEKYLSEAYRPVLRGLLVIGCLAYLLMTVVNFVTIPNSPNKVWLVSMTAATAFCCASFFYIFQAKGMSNLGQLETLATLTFLLILSNVIVQQTFNFQSERLQNFSILALVMAVMGGRMRIAMPLITLSVLACIVFVSWLSPEEQPQYYSLIVGMTVASFALNWTLQKIVTREIKARVLAEELRQKEETRADTDVLTGLATRGKLLSEISSAAEETKDHNQTIRIAILDVDDFRTINNVHGHSIGDELLVAITRRLSGFLNESVLLSRSGPDEFALFSFGGAYSPGEDEIRGIISAVFEETFIFASLELRVSASVGYVEEDRSNKNSELFFEQAEYSLQKAKLNKSDDFVVFSQDLSREMKSQQTLDLALRASDFEPEMYLEFQPQVEVGTGVTVAFEALARWSSPELGDVPPALFIRSAERTGLINQLTLVLLQKALEAVQAWPDEIGLSFNLSAHDIASSTTVSRICEMIEDSELSPSRIEFELTETAVVEDFEEARKVFAQLSELGVRIAIDDFGAGQSSFSNLSRLPFDKLKVDRGFVLQLEQQGKSLKIIRSIVDLCINLEVDCIVEGVETKAELDLLRGVGVNLIQGFVYSKPIGLSNMSELFSVEGITSKHL